MNDLLFGLGMVAIVEGLILALAPGRLGQLLATLETLGPDRLRQAGLLAISLGVLLVWVVRG